MKCKFIKEISYQFDIPATLTASEDLPLSSVAEMLHRKIRNQTSCRSMTEENIQHLKQRLLGTLGKRQIRKCVAVPSKALWISRDMI